MRHLISPLDFTVEETYEVLDFADRIAANPKAYAHAADGRQLATLFYEPSTRTRLSFESAMLSLGGQTIGFAGADQSSVSKGETIADTVRVVSCYADIIVMRHPKEGAPLCASMYSKIPVINAGDGGHNHPTQTLIDLMTIRQRLGRLDNLTIGFCGDLKFGRTVHSLVKSLVRHTGNKFYFISPEELRIPDYLVDETLEPTHTPYEEVSSLEDSLPKLDVLYMTRVQKERFFNEEDYVRMKDFYVLDQEKAEKDITDHIISILNYYDYDEDEANKLAKEVITLAKQYSEWISVEDKDIFTKKDIESVLKQSFIILNAIYTSDTINDWVLKIQQNNDFSDCKNDFYDNELYNIGRMLHSQFEMWIFELRKAKEQLQNKNTL